jgi:hypothetical protein
MTPQIKNVVKKVERLAWGLLGCHRTQVTSSFDVLRKRQCPRDVLARARSEELPGGSCLGVLGKLRRTFSFLVRRSKSKHILPFWRNLVYSFFRSESGMACMLRTHENDPWIWTRRHSRSPGSSSLRARANTSRGHCLLRSTSNEDVTWVRWHPKRPHARRSTFFTTFLICGVIPRSNFHFHFSYIYFHFLW